MRSPLRRPSPSMVVACLSLGIALSGIAYAATLPANSVGSPQVKPNSLRGADVRESSFGKVPNANRLDGKDSTAFAPKRVRVIKVVSCPGYGFVPFDTVASWGAVAMVKYLSGTSGGTAVTCPLDLPNGARVIQMGVSLVDFHTNGRITEVRLERVKLSGGSVGVVENLASVNPSTDPTQTPGNYEAIDDTIVSTSNTDVVQNQLYAYGVTAAFNAGTSQALALGVRGARIVMYLNQVPTATPAPGP